MGDDPTPIYGPDPGDPILGGTSGSNSSISFELSFFLGAIVGQTNPNASTPAKNNPNYQTWLKPYQAWLSGRTTKNPPKVQGNTGSQGFQNNDCAIAAIQNMEKNLGIPILPREQIIQLMGMTDRDFNDDSDGLDETPSDDAAILNKVFTTQGYTVSAKSFKGAAGLSALASQAYAQQGGLFVTSFLPFNKDPKSGVPFGIPTGDHIMAAAIIPGSSGSNAGPQLLLENTDGQGTTALFTAAQALQSSENIYSNQYGVSNQIWMVVPTPPKPH